MNSDGQPAMRSAVQSVVQFRWVLLWFAAQLVALASNAIAFGILLGVVAGLGGFQNADRRSSAGRRGLSSQPAGRPAARSANQSTGQSTNQPTNKPAGKQDQTNRLIGAYLSAVFAVMLTLSGLVDLRLAGVVITGAVLGSLVVAWQAERVAAKTLTRAGELVLAWLVVGVPACALVALAQESVAGAVVLVCVVFAYEVGASIWASQNVDLLSVLRQNLRRTASNWHQLAGIFAGLLAAAATVFAVTAISLPPYEPTDALRLMLVLLVMLPLGQTIVIRYENAVAPLPNSLPNSPLNTPPNTRLGALASPWVLRRLGTAIVLAPTWLWALEVIRF